MVAVINIVVSLISLSQDSQTHRDRHDLRLVEKICRGNGRKQTFFFLSFFIWGASTVEYGTLEALVSPKDVIQSGD